MPNYSTLSTEELLNKLSSRGLIRYLEREGLLTKSKLSPLMNEAAITQARQDLMNIQSQGGHKAKVDAYRKIALPILGRDVPFKPDGTVDDEKFSTDMHEALDAAQRMQAQLHGAEHPQKKTVLTKDQRGRTVETTEEVNPLTGQPLGGGKYVSKLEEPDTGKIAQEVKSEFRKRDDMKPIFEAQANLNTAKRILNDPERGNNYKDALLITAFSKLEDPAGVVRQQKIAYLEDKSSQLDQLRKRVSHILTDQNATLTQNDRRDIAQAITLLEHGYYDTSKTAYDDLVEEANKRGLQPEDVLSKQERVAYGYERGQAATPPGPIPVSEEKGGKISRPAAVTPSAPAKLGSAANPFPFKTDEEVKTAPADAEFIVDARPGKPSRIFHNPNFQSVTSPISKEITPTDVEPSQP